MTDIVATSTEHTGDYEIRSTTISDNVLSADVCVAEPRRAAEVANSIVRQLLNHGYRSVILNIGSRAGSAGRFVWSGTGERGEPGGTPATVCSDHRTGEPSAPLAFRE